MAPPAAMKRKFACPNNIVTDHAEEKNMQGKENAQSKLWLSCATSLETSFEVLAET